MPEVAIYDAPDLNAFATGWNRNDALVAVSTGLLRNMDKDEAEAVLGHEISHVANGDMVTLALIQGVVNTFVIFFAKLFGIMVMWFSRQRELRADAGGARLAGSHKIIAALERLKLNHEQTALPEKMAAFGISGGKGMMHLFMTHPPLEDRIAALRAGQ